jgi:hypothetical protein
MNYHYGPPMSSYLDAGEGVVGMAFCSRDRGLYEVLEHHRSNGGEIVITRDGRNKRKRRVETVRIEDVDHDFRVLDGLVGRPLIQT